MTKYIIKCFSALSLLFLNTHGTEVTALGQIGVVITDTSINNKVSVIVKEVLPNSPAATAGIVPNDILYTLDGLLINSSLEFIGNIKSINEAITVRIEIYRDGVKILKEITVKIIEGPHIHKKGK